MGPQGVLPGFESLAVSLEVLDERERQNELWGEQNHEMVNWGEDDYERYSMDADSLKRLNAGRVQVGLLAWDGILLEEVYEALAEEDPQKQREELIQVAAVAQAMVECIDRKEARDPNSESSASTEQSVSTGAAKG